LGIESIFGLFREKPCGEQLVNNQLVVVHYCSTWLPLTQTWIYTQVSQLQRLGINTHVACKKMENKSDFNIDKLHSRSSESLFRKLRRIGLEALRMRDDSPFLMKVAGSVEADIVHSHFGDVGWENLGALRAVKAHHVVTFYGYDVNMLPVQNAQWIDRYGEMFSQADMFLCEGSHMARCIVGLGCPAHKVLVHHLGVDISKLKFSPRQWRSGETLRILIAASFREKKGIPIAIQALGIIARDIPVELTIIGDAGPSPDEQKEKESIMEALSSTGLMSCTRLLGYQPHNAMLSEALKHHILLQPSITAGDGDTEGGAPVSIIEMLATGMPVVATTHCDIPEVVGPAFAHFLAPERDVEQLAGRIRLLLSDPDSWTALLKAGRDHIEREYNLETQVNRLVKIYEGINKVKHVNAKS
jgi:colanic acid/amylovoran biosynthesis glycosyltransferase